MTSSPFHSIARAALLLTATIAVFAGCAVVDPGHSAVTKPSEVKAVNAAPLRTIADFSAGLRCMDTLLLDYGARDITVIVEDLVNQNQGTGSGAKDMLMSVVSDMTQRSRAIRVVASGKDWGNTVNAMAAFKREQFAVVPQYALRGSISLLDNQNVQRNNETATASVLSIDLTMLTTQDLSVVPGIATRNSVVLFKQGKAFDGRAEIRKFGVAYGLSSANGDVLARASRSLAELASIELFGRLAKVPYWTCLGVTDAHEGVSAEIQDWYDAMAAQPAEVIKYFQTQLRARRVYEGPIDGTVNPQLKDAVARYRAVLGLSHEPKLSLDFFKAYLAADHHQLEARVTPASTAVAAPAGAPVPTPSAAATVPVAPAAAVQVVDPSASTTTALTLRIATVNETRRYAPGEKVELMIRPSRSAHVYCFLQDEQRKIRRFFPNRFQSDSRVQPDEGLQLPGKMRFELAMNPHGKQETVACFATERDVLARLPVGINAGDFDELAVASMDQVRSAFVRVANGALAQDSFQLQPK